MKEIGLLKQIRNWGYIRVMGERNRVIEIEQELEIRVMGE